MSGRTRTSAIAGGSGPEPPRRLGLLLVVDEEERSVRLLLLGKAAVLAHRFERPLAAEMDDEEQSRAEARVVVAMWKLQALPEAMAPAPPAPRGGEVRRSERSAD